MAVLESRDSGKTFHIVTLSPEAESLDPPVQSGSECNDAADHLPILQDIDVCRAMTRAWRTGTPSLLSDIYFNTGTRSGWRNAFVFRLGSNRVGIIYDDITPHKEAQRHQLQARKLEALGTLARGVSHELNNILMAITGFTGLALSRSEDDKIRTYLKHIQAAHTRAESLVRQLHFFSRTEQTSMESLDIGIMARECLQSLKATLPDTLTTSFYAASDLYRIKGDPSLIHQLLDQLMHNAAQALPQEGGQLFVHIENVPPGPLDEPGLFSVAETEQGWVRIEIRDTGPGMAPNVQDRIFDPFFTTRPMPGRLGLGLSVVHGIVQAHNGYLSVHAPRGQGSSFTILLPGIVPEPGKNAPFPATALLRDATLRPKHVLIIDDQPELLLMQQEGLEGMGYKTTCCLTGEDGLRTYLEYRDAIDIVLVDYAMPDMNGLEVAERIHAHSSTPPPILLYTGFLPIDIRDSLDLPFITEILYKPISIKELASRLRQTLDTPTKDER
jgi:signal transduction histidine kinase/CheY-like chemotaxis protein